MAKAARNVADFPKAGDEGVNVTADLSGESWAHVYKKNPDLQYRFCRPENKRQWEMAGYRDNPPDIDGNPAEIRKKTPDVILMACDKSVGVARDAVRQEKSHKFQAKVKQIANATTNETVGAAGGLRNTPPPQEE